MGNRIIKESICSSDSIGMLSFFEEVCFYHLIVICDDFGRADGRLDVLRNRMFQVDTRSVTAKQIDAALDKMVTAGMVARYTVNGKPYLQLLSWDRHQNVRNKKSKYPGPDQADPVEKPVENFNCQQLNTIDVNCEQLKTFDVPIQSNPNPIQFLSESNPAREARPVENSKKKDDDVVFSTILYDNSEFSITAGDIRSWKREYPGVDIIGELAIIKKEMELGILQGPRQSGKKLQEYINGRLKGKAGGKT